MCQQDTFCLCFTDLHQTRLFSLVVGGALGGSQELWGSDSSANKTWSLWLNFIAWAQTSHPWCHEVQQFILQMLNSPSSPSPPAVSWSELHSRCPRTGRSRGRVCCRNEAEDTQEENWEHQKRYLCVESFFKTLIWAELIRQTSVNWLADSSPCYQPSVWFSAGCFSESFESLPRDSSKCSGSPVVWLDLWTRCFCEYIIVQYI